MNPYWGCCEYKAGLVKGVAGGAQKSPLTHNGKPAEMYWRHIVAIGPVAEARSFFHF
jgi:hypothetical protein